jgi:hypothetical protein
MNLREEIERACDPTRPRKSPAHLLLLPLAFGVAGVCCYFLVHAAVHFAAIFRDGTANFSSYTEPTKTLIVLPMILASFPLGLLAANLAAWHIPAARRYFEREARGRPSGDFRSSMQGLLLFTKWVSTPLAVLALAAAIFGE